MPGRSPAASGVLSSFVMLVAVYARSRTHPRPVVDLTLFRIPSFRWGTIGTLLFFGLGFGLDRWLGTTPLFMILLVVIYILQAIVNRTMVQ